MIQVIRELKRQVAGEKLAPEQLKGLIRAGYSTGTATSTSSRTWAATLWLSLASTRARMPLRLQDRMRGLRTLRTITES